MTTGRLLREIERQHMKRCDKDPPHYGCNNPTHVTRTLHNIPNVFSVLLAWEPDVQGDTIAETLQCVDTVLQPTVRCRRRLSCPRTRCCILSLCRCGMRAATRLRPA